MRKIYNLFSQVYRKNKAKTLSVLGILGSPRIGGNSDILLERALEGAQESGASAEKIILNSLNIAPCQACEELEDNTGCIVEDDMQDIYAKVQQADVIIIASPIYFGSLSSQTKIMIDRFQCWWRLKNILNSPIDSKKKQGAFICVQAGDKEEFFANSRSIIKNLFATINAEYTDELLCPGVEDKGSVLEKPEVMDRAFELGQKLVEQK
ncbi:MAG: flavodoxin family protein [Candidatus Omnitrophota bacterium]